MEVTTQMLREQFAKAMNGSWSKDDEDTLECDQGSVYVSLMVTVDWLKTGLPCFELYEITADQVSTGVGTEAVMVLRELADKYNHALVIGPNTNPAYWGRPCFSWLEARGSDGQMLVYIP